ncbi:hypothetical protein F2Q68_00007583 [Brassica cretica]|uniref:glucan endo-1,3-beta-D-glucosidase n=1 Tax=Brassica cretica TaxID=69181 RepID=A0A8S9L110_BRACR|nr:hypothetical protein F2Q68_00007583 [Brassica cretica]
MIRNCYSYRGCFMLEPVNGINNGLSFKENSHANSPWENVKPKLATIEEGGTSGTANVNESNFNISAQDKGNIALNDVVAISELERLMEGKTFSRAETDRLIEILNSRATDLSDVVRDERVEIPLREGVKKNMSFLDKRKQPIGAKDASSELWATPTPLAKSITLDGVKQVRDEAGLSPAELAKAYMGGQTPSSSSQGFVARNEKNSLDGGMFVANYSGASPSSKPSARWPGFFLAQLMQLQDNSSKRLSTLQSPSQSAQTRYGQLKFSKGSESGVFGPSRRARQSATMSPYSRPSRGRFENSANMKSYEAGESSISMPQTTTYGKHIGLEVGTPTVPRHSSQIARTILDHLERTQPTPRDKSAELKLATSWRYPQSSKTVEPSNSNINNVTKDGSVKLNEDIRNVISNVPPSSVAKLPEVTTRDAQNAITKTASASNGIFSGSSSASEDAVKAWFATNIEPYLADVNIAFITIGNEVIPGPIGPQVLPVMTSLTNLVKSRNLRISISTVVSMGNLGQSYPPSAGMFTSQAREQLTPVLKFLSQTSTPILVNIYPYFPYASDPVNIHLDYATSKSEAVVVQDGPLGYSNLFDAMFDAFLWAMEKEGVKGLPMVVSETGWPSAGNGEFTTPDIAATYNGNFVKHVDSGKGTPKRPNSGVDGFIFATFNENQKPPGTEQNFGLYNPVDMKPIYKLFSV